MVDIPDRVLLSHKEKCNPVICKKVDGTKGYHVKWYKPVTEGHVSYVFSHVVTLKKQIKNVTVTWK